MTKVSRAGERGLWYHEIGLSEEPKQRVLDAHGVVKRRAGAAKVVRQADVEWGEGRTKEALTPYGLARSM